MIDRVGGPAGRPAGNHANDGLVGRISGSAASGILQFLSRGSGGARSLTEAQSGSGRAPIMELIFQTFARGRPTSWAPEVPPLH